MGDEGSPRSTSQRNNSLATLPFPSRFISKSLGDKCLRQFKKIMGIVKVDTSATMAGLVDIARLWTSPASGLCCLIERVGL